MSDILRVLSGIANFTAVYYVTVMSRCAIMSLPVLGLILLLRTTIFRNRVLWKGAGWLLILLVPFFGKLRVYYEVWLGIPFIYCQYLPTAYPLLRWGYLSVAFCLLIRALVKRMRAKSLLRYTTKSLVSGQTVFLTDAQASPFVVGLIKPKIILPRVLIKELSAFELETIVLHEKTHIRLGHLWIFLLWDVFAAIFWLNPLFSAAAGWLREDMEQLCDYATMERGRKEPLEYGGLLLKSMGLLWDEDVRADVMFFRESGYPGTKRRFERIAAFRLYPRRMVLCLLTGFALAIAAGIFLINTHSLPGYTILSDITVGDEKGNVYADGEEAELAGAVIRKGDELVIDARKLRTFLPEDFSENEYIYFYYDTVMKLPGMGVGGRCAWVENLPAKGLVKTREGKAPWWDRAICWALERI